MSAPSDQLVEATSCPSFFDAPVFIVGSPRSGTTWLQRLLLSHPAVVGGQESHFFVYFYPPIREILKTRDMERNRATGLRAYWTEEALLGEVRKLWRQTIGNVISPSGDASILLEKSPNHALYMKEIQAVLPGCRFIHLIRDSRAVVASMLAAGRDGWASHWAPRGAARAALKWRRHVVAARDQGVRLGPERYMELHYEDLHSRPLEELRRVFQFLGLDVTDEVLAEIVESQRFDVQKRQQGSPIPVGGMVASSGKREVKEPVGFFRRGTPNAWKDDLSGRQKVVTWLLTRQVMRAYGYDRQGRRGGVVES